LDPVLYAVSNGKTEPFLEKIVYQIKASL